MASASEKERGTFDRGTETVPARDVRGKKIQTGPYSLRAQKSGKDITGLQVRDQRIQDEILITPNAKFRREQGLREQAESVAASAAKGQHFKDDYLQGLEQSLGKMGQDNRQLTAAVRSVRDSQAKKDVARTIAETNRGQPPGEVSSQKPLSEQPSVTPPERIADVIGSIINDSASRAASVAKVRGEAEARGLTNRFGRGEPVAPSEVRRSARNLVDAARRTDTPLSPALESLAGILSSLIDKEAGRIGEAAQRGEGVAAGYLDSLQGERLGVERQGELLGYGSAEAFPKMVLDLAGIKESQLRKEAKKATQRNTIGEVYAQFLTFGLLSYERSSELLGRDEPQVSAERRDQVDQLAKIPRVPAIAEAKDVISRAKSDEHFNDGYVELLKSSLRLKGGPEGGKLADALREQQFANLKRDVIETSRRAKAGERIPELYINYLQQRAVKLGEEGKNSADDLKRTLEDLIG